MDYWTGSRSIRELSWLVARLPSGARVYNGDWSQDTHFQVIQIDLLNMMVWQNYLIGMALGLKAKDFKKPPKPMPRPGEEKKKKDPERFSTKQDFENMISRARKGG